MSKQPSESEPVSSKGSIPHEFVICSYPKLLFV